MRQRAAASSQWADSSSVPKRTCSSTPKRSATPRRYARISGCGENVDDQFGFGANENE